jgi:hypothetical protein
MNASIEFLNATQGHTVFCCHIQIITNDKMIDAKLPVDHTDDDYRAFINSINVEYDDKNSIQQVYGTIWCTQSNYFNRKKDIYSEWWHFNEYPSIPDFLFL